MLFLRQCTRAPIFHLVFRRTHPSVFYNSRPKIILRSNHKMTKEISFRKQLYGDKVVEMKEGMSFRKQVYNTQEDNTESDKAIELWKQKQRERRAKPSVTVADNGTAEEDTVPYFIDTSPTPVDLAAVKIAGVEDVNNEVGENRASVRREKRRLMLIERQRKVISERLGIPEGSESHPLLGQLEAQLNTWTLRRDRTDEAREERKRVRKSNEKERLKKRGVVVPARWRSIETKRMREDLQKLWD
ncbi:hypothetical protein F4859DRAFT_24102 [Xylaria cf. heliscus]|nr:hypothetical protein F4859DRAFT_24102 [Xylaria cf. heliscus]